jgi:hypothetical protein
MAYRIDRAGPPVIVASLLLCAPAVASAAPGTLGAFALPAHAAAGAPEHQTFVFKGRRIVIGSASQRARDMQRAHPEMVLPTAPLYVADPSLDGVMVYDERANGNNILPYGILSGANTQIDGPVAVATGEDLPCTGTSVCQPYLWVSNAGNNTITFYTLPLTAWNQAPAGVISGGGPGCGPGVSAPYGIVHTGPYSNGTAPGQILETSEANLSGSYYIVGYQANGATTCNTSNTSVYVSPSGPSVYATSGMYDVFNANSRTVTDTGFLPTNTWFNPASSWLVGPASGASTEGTAVFGTANLATSYVYVTTNANANFTNDAVWRCQLSAFPSCPSTPVCVNPGADLDFPDFPAISVSLRRIYVPNQNNGTVTAYKTNAACTHKATFVNTQTPFGVALTL